MLALRYLPPRKRFVLRWRVPAGLSSIAAQPPALPAAAAVIGSPGASSQRYLHTQASPASPWIVNHNLGFRPGAVSVRNAGGVEVEAQVVHQSVNQLTIQFAVPTTGSAVIL